MLIFDFFKNTFRILVFIIFFNSYGHSEFDLTVVGNAIYSDGLGRLPISLIHTLKDDLKINFISSSGKEPTNMKDIPEGVQKVLKIRNKSAGRVSILFDAPWHIYGEPYKKMPDSSIKLAYSMLEASLIPDKWVDIFNNNFDAVVVPDNFLVKVYQDSGVKIPIFVLPCILFLNPFLQKPIKEKANNPFKFGISAGFGIEKGQDILIDAFAKEFANNPKVKLIIHGRWGGAAAVFQKKIKDLKLTNVRLFEKILSQQEYIRFLRSLDCYVLFSRGEGFSITPRESLALGIPCILTNHTAHKTICSAGYALPVNAEIKMPIHYSLFNCSCGYQLACSVEDAQKALKEAYENYGSHLEKAMRGRQWVRQYTPGRQRKKYLNLLKPEKVILGSQNEITDNYLMTNSHTLYKKYIDLKK